MNRDNGSELGILKVALMPEAVATFKSSPALSLHAALLRRLELVTPDVSLALHNAPKGAPSSEHPWTVSSLLGSLHRERDNFVATPENIYYVRITALAPQVIYALDSAFNPDHPFGKEPLMLEHVPFSVVPEQSHWEQLATYASLLTRARPFRNIPLEFLSPTGFRTRQGGLVSPEPLICIGGYLRKWRAFSEIILEEEAVLEFAENHMTMGRTYLRPVMHRLGKYSKRGFVGRVEWRADNSLPDLLRFINALVDYAIYCGTGAKTTMGMGQTRRIRVSWR